LTDNSLQTQSADKDQQKTLLR